jgi:Tol biopolymer transport system component
LAVFIIIAGILFSNEENSKFPILKGPYLGQKPPGMIPEIFAPGIVSTEKTEMNSVFSPNGKEFFFARRDGKTLVMYFSRKSNGRWTKPEAFPYCEGIFNGDMSYSPDGRRLYYCSDRKTDDYLGSLDIWYCERTESGWSEPVHLGPTVNSASSDTYPVFTKNGGLFFGSDREGGMGDKDLYYTRLVDGSYTKPIPLGNAINSEYGEGDTYVAFDESYMIINTWGRPDCYGSGDLYISFKLADGSWSKAKNMGERINTEFLEFCPMMSPDGKYLFYTSNRRGNGDIYWVDAGIIEKLKPDELK